MPPAFPVSRPKLPHEVSYVSPLLPALSLPRAPRLQAASSRKIVHMHGIGGDGEYCSDNDAQLGCINVFLAPHTSGPRDVPRCGALSLLQKDAALQWGDPAETAVG